MRVEESQVTTERVTRIGLAWRDNKVFVSLVLLSIADDRFRCAVAKTIEDVDEMDFQTTRSCSVFRANHRRT